MDPQILAAVTAEIIRRRKAAAAVISLIVDARNRAKKTRKLWAREWLLRRNEGKGVLTMLFEELGPEDPPSFKNYTRMSEGVFNELLELVTPFILKRDTVMRQAISPKDRLSATLRYLATGNTFQELAYSLRIAPNTLSQIVDVTCKSIIRVLESWVMKFPTTPEEWQLISDRFGSNWQFPHCIGAMDGKHIAFRPPRKEGSNFRNYKGRGSIVLLAIVDADYKFIFVDIGRNGRMHDSTVFRRSPVGLKLESGSLNLPEPSTLPGFAQNMPYVIVGGDAFPLRRNLMKPYPEKNLTLDQRIFNYRLSRAWRMSENAFGILANRFRVLLTTIPLSVQKVEITTYTCVLLHNFLLLKKCRQWYVPSNCRGENPELLESGLRGIARQGGNRCAVPAQEVRDNYCEYFNTSGAVTWQYEAVEKGNR